MDLSGKKVLIVGLGASGAAAARLAVQRGAVVRAVDQGQAPSGAGEARAAGAEVILGAQRDEDFAWAEIIVLSPGVDQRMAQVRSAAERGALVMGELELGFRFLASPAVMITGTNGKSTVTTLIGEMLAAAGLKVFVGGNLGSPLCGFLADGGAADWAVLEVSSFQLDTALELRPRVGLCLNITPDHLDRYDSAADYADSKMRLFANQSGGDVAILWMDDAEIAARVGRCPAQVWAYQEQGPVEPGAWLEGDDLVLAPEPGLRSSLSAKASPLVGRFNRLNLLAAGLAGLACGLEPGVMQKVIDRFRGLRHRLEPVAELGGVLWLDDSKGTNVGAVQAALGAVDRPVVLLLGGRDKEGRFAGLAPQLRARAAGVICFGEAGPSIAAQLEGIADCQQAGGLEEAVTLAAEMARPGQAVLLSPGCASFDAYTGYAKRGEHFARLVHGLALGEAGA